LIARVIFQLLGTVLLLLSVGELVPATRLQTLELFVSEQYGGTLTRNQLVAVLKTPMVDALVTCSALYMLVLATALLTSQARPAIARGVGVALVVHGVGHAVMISQPTCPLSWIGKGQLAFAPIGLALVLFGGYGQPVATKPKLN